MKKHWWEAGLAVAMFALGLAMCGGLFYVLFKFGPPFLTWLLSAIGIPQDELLKKIILSAIGVAITVGGALGVRKIRDALQIGELYQRTLVLIATTADVRRSHTRDEVAFAIDAEVSAQLFREKEMDKIVKYVSPSNARVLLRAIAAYRLLAEALEEEKNVDKLVAYIQAIDLTHVASALRAESWDRSQGGEDFASYLKKLEG